MQSEKQGVNIIIFLVLAVAISSIFWALIISSGHVGGGAGHYVEGLMWSPALAAFLTVAIRRIDIRTLGFGWGNAKFAWIAYLTPLAYAAIAYTFVWSLGFGSFPNPDAIAAVAHKLGWTVTSPMQFLPLYFVMLATVIMISSMAHALGEEIGWRGFLAPRMVNKLGFTWGAVITGLIWAAWHFPILLFADYNSGTPWWFGLPCFAVMVVGISVILTWIRLRSNSVWPCAILHASHNLFIQGFFTPMTKPTNLTAYAIDEFGVAVPVVVVIFAIVFWTMRNKAVATGAEAIA